MIVKTTTTTASASSPTSTVFHKPPAHPSTVASASATFASTPGADEATTAVSPATTAPARRKKASTGRRFLPPGSLGLSSARFQLWPRSLNEPYLRRDVRAALRQASGGLPATRAAVAARHPGKPRVKGVHPVRRQLRVDVRQLVRIRVEV